MDALSSISSSAPLIAMQQAQAGIAQAGAALAGGDATAASSAAAGGVALAASIVAIKAEHQTMGMLVDILA